MVVNQFAVEREPRHIANVMYPQQRIATQIQFRGQRDLPDGGIREIVIRWCNGDMLFAGAQRNFPRWASRLKQFRFDNSVGFEWFVYHTHEIGVIWVFSQPERKPFI